LKTVYLGLGTNLGNKTKNLSNALNLISHFCKPVKISGVYGTVSMLRDSQDDYFNMVVKCETFLPPDELLFCIKTAEKKCGREYVKRWGSRIIDIDIIDYNSEVLEFDNLQIPHYGMTERSFVLYPLSEIAPEYIHPISCLKIDEMVKLIKDDYGLKRLGELAWLS